MPSPQTRPEHPARHDLAALAALVGAGGEAASWQGVAVTGLSLSTSRVLPGDLYAALPGSRAHGASYAGAAAEAGAVAVLTDPEGATDAAATGLPVLVVPQVRPVLGALAARVYGDPATRLRLIGVTGTQGKTTTTRLLEDAAQRAGVSSAVIGTVGTRILGADVHTALTTPEAPDLHGLFAAMVERGVDLCAMEVSSHALRLGRVDGVRFDVAVFLNLGRDHLDFHTDLEDYFQAKASLFAPERCRRALIVVDDEHGRRLVEQVRGTGVEVRTLALHGDADWRAVDLDLGADGSTFRLVGPEGTDLTVRVPLPGAFNVANAACALAAAAEAGLDAGPLARAMAAGAGVPGRLERVDAGQPFTVVVDYAHKPDAVEAILRALRPLTSGRVIVVIGAGGDRDRGKRPVMGRLAAELGDVVLVTDDNPRTEEPAAIRAEVVAGVREALAAGAAAEVLEVGDRGEAIARACAMAAPGDIVLVAGKGHERGQEVHGVVHPFDDREVAAREAARYA